MCGFERVSFGKRYKGNKNVVVKILGAFYNVLYKFKFYAMGEGYGQIKR